MLLDEPDAFLHPEQARRLGRWIGNRAKASEQQLIVATHNSHFLQGMISVGGEPQIFRLNRPSSGVTATVRKFGTDPLLSSQRVVEAIFHTLAIVCEADSDRTIYQAVASQELNNTEVLFVNAQNKQTCAKVVEALNEAGIAARTVVDIDMLRDADELKKLMNAHAVPPDVQQEVQTTRKEIANAIEEVADSDDVADIPEKLRQLADQAASAEMSKKKIQSEVEDMLRVGKWSNLKSKGVAALEEQFKAKADALIGRLLNYGIAIVPVGELESWIDLPETKPRWIAPALERIYAKEAPAPLKDFVAKLIAPVTH
jgi:predicted ATP-dependent endonuclease of OLD family